MHARTTASNTIVEGEVGVEPPSKSPVELLFAIDVCNRDDDGLEFHLDLPGSLGLDCGFATRLNHAHVRLLMFGA
jgi:hypothetical protein